MMKSPHRSTEPPQSGGTQAGCLFLAIAPVTTALTILVWYGSAGGCWGGDPEVTSGYCLNIARWLGDGLGLIVMTGVFMAIGLTVSAILGGTLSWLLGRRRQPVSGRTLVAAEIALGLLVGAIPFFLVAFGVS